MEDEVMADMDNPLKNLPDLRTVEDGVEELVTLSTDPMKLVAKKTMSAYVQAAIVAATAVPLLAAGGPTSISQAPARKQDVEQTVPSQTHSTVLQGPTVIVISTSAGRLGR